MPVSPSVFLPVPTGQCVPRAPAHRRAPAPGASRKKPDASVRASGFFHAVWVLRGWLLPVFFEPRVPRVERFCRLAEVVAHDDVIFMLAAVEERIDRHAALHGIVPDDAGAELADGKRIRRAQAAGAVVHARAADVARDDAVDAAFQADVRVIHRVFRRLFLKVAAAVPVKNVARDGNRIGDVVARAAADGDRRAVAAVKIVAREAAAL